MLVAAAALLLLLTPFYVSYGTLFPRVSVSFPTFCPFKVVCAHFCFLRSFECASFGLLTSRVIDFMRTYGCVDVAYPFLKYYTVCSTLQDEFFVSSVLRVEMKSVFALV